MIRTFILCAFLACAFASRNWAGSWYVANQLSSGLSACDVPAYLTVVNITANGKNLVLEGISANDLMAKTWTLDWSDEEQGYSYCSSDDWCVAGFLIHENGATFANITWHLSDDPTTWCSSLLSPATLNWVGHWFVAQSQENQNCGVPVNNSIVNIEAYGDQLLMAGYESHGGAITSWTLNFTAQELHAQAACLGYSSCVDADLAVHSWLLIGNLSWLNFNFWFCNATLVKLPPNVGDNLTSLTNLDYQEVEKLLSSQPESLIA